MASRVVVAPQNPDGSFSEEGFDQEVLGACKYGSQLADSGSLISVSIICRHTKTRISANHTPNELNLTIRKFKNDFNSRNALYVLVNFYIFIYILFFTIVHFPSCAPIFSFFRGLSAWSYHHGKWRCTMRDSD